MSIKDKRTQTLWTLQAVVSSDPEDYGVATKEFLDGVSDGYASIWMKLKTDSLEDLAKYVKTVSDSLMDLSDYESGKKAAFNICTAYLEKQGF